jgi:HNH endonuclease
VAYNESLDVSKPKITVVGQLRYSESEGLQGSVPDLSLSEAKELGLLNFLRCAPERRWLEVLPNAYEWHGIPPPNDDKADYARRLHAEPSYKEAAKHFFERQRRDPQRLSWGNFWGYKDKVLRFASDEPEIDTEQTALLVKHYILRRDRQFDRIQREIEAFENLEKLEGSSREPISESVRLFVWQRDKGQCVKCGSRERLEFDHIIPVTLGGSNTERNIQLLCEPCNRSKGANV